MTSLVYPHLACIILCAATNLCLAASDLPGGNPLQPQLRNKAKSATRVVENSSSASIQLPWFITKTPITEAVNVIGEAPTKMAYYDDFDDTKGYQNSRREAKWIPFSTNFVLDLAPQNGQRLLYYGFAWENPARVSWRGSWIHVWYPPLILYITNPPQSTVSQPSIHVLGYSPRPLVSIKYSVRSGNEESQERFGFYGPVKFGPTHTFSCYDIPLREGINVVKVRGQDLASNVFVTNIIYNLDLKIDHTPPVMTLNFPKKSGGMASGNEFEVSGWVDDYTAQIFAEMRWNGRTNLIPAQVGSHNGLFIVPHIPFAGPEGWLVLTATDAAGNQSRTNLHLFRSSLVISQNRPEWNQFTDLYKTSGTLSNTEGKIYTVWVNGVKAKMENNSRWSAENVPSSTGYGHATFIATAVPDATGPALTSPANTKSGGTSPDAVLVSAPYATNGVNLECIASNGGQLKMHLSGTRNQSFILFASTNLIQWIPLITNYNSGENFEYVDPAAGDYPCRYYRILPIK